MTNILVIMVSGGADRVSVSRDPEKKTSHSVELIHTNGTRLCSLPDLPTDTYRHSQTGLTLCGGDYSPRSCHTFYFSTGSWEESHKLAMDRTGHSAWRSPQGILLIGGYSSEILTESGDTTPGPTFRTVG